MAAYGLKNARDPFLYAHAEDFIDDIKFFLLYDGSYSREVYLYWKFHSFDLDNFDFIYLFYLNPYLPLVSMITKANKFQQNSKIRKL